MFFQKGKLIKNLFKGIVGLSLLLGIPDLSFSQTKDYKEVEKIEQEKQHHQRVAWILNKTCYFLQH